MDNTLDAITLTQQLVAVDTINPPGNERRCAEILAPLLESSGYRVNFFEFAHQRTSLIAQMEGKGTGPSICFTGHLDTIPLGGAPWQREPFAGEIDEGRLYGRGASDMKSGAAAMVVMMQRLARFPELAAKVILILTAGEETCCQGAQYLRQQKRLPQNVGALIVGEPTANAPLIGHKGCVRFAVTTTGVTAHAAMPEMGENAIYKAAQAVLILQQFDFQAAAHPLLGTPTLNVGTIEGGLNINSVPDRTTIGVDIRTIPGQDHRQVQDALKHALGPETTVEMLEAATSIATDANHRWVQEVFQITRKVTGVKPEPAAATYFTDASVLTPAFDNPPTIIIGPGELEMAHKTDEYCEIVKIEQAVEIYAQMVERWCDPTR